MTSRRGFLKKTFLTGTGALLTAPFWASLFGIKRYEKSVSSKNSRRWDQLNPAAAGAADLAAMRHPVSGVPGEGDFARAAELTRRMIEGLGGMARFVSPGDIVYVKPNIGWARAPEYAATTNPDVVGELVRLSIEAGAKEVLVGDRTCEQPKKCYEDSRIGPAVAAAGGRMVFPRRFERIRSELNASREWLIDANYLEADRVINVAVAKHHALTGASLTMKNLFGIVGGERSRLHQRVHESIAELAFLFRPTLNVVDGVRTLVSNGPQGGSLRYVESPLTVIGGIDPVAVDTFALRHLFGGRYATAAQLPGFVARAEEYGVGRREEPSSLVEGFGG